MKKIDEVYVTQPTTPPLNEFFGSLRDIWQSKWITNNGKYHQKFEKELCKYLGINYCSLTANGTLGLMIGLRALDIKGEVITTPFSFVATAHAIRWSGAKPVFCDIEETSLNINPKKIQNLINPETTAILPVHVYGNPCNLKEIEEIADEHNLKVIYDAAHAFNTKIDGKTILNSGDLSVLSFHATKVFNTIEGGAIITKNEDLKLKIDRLKNFGFADNESVLNIGLNGKMNELQAAYGLLELKIIDEEIEKRKKIKNFYKENLKDITGIKLLKEIRGVTHSNPYFPIFINEKKYGKSRDSVYEIMKNEAIITRKYFYPLISQFSCYNKLPSASYNNLHVAKKVSEEVLCLPIYGNLKRKTIKKIINILRRK